MTRVRVCVKPPHVPGHCGYGVHGPHKQFVQFCVHSDTVQAMVSVDALMLQDSPPPLA